MRSVERAHDGEGDQRHHLLMELGQTLHMRLAIMPMQRFNLLRLVLVDPRRTSPVLQQVKLLSVIRIDLGQGCKLRFNGQREFIWIERRSPRRPNCTGDMFGHDNLSQSRPIVAKKG